MAKKAHKIAASENESLGMLLVISGPAGVGKDTVWQTAQACLPSFVKTITCTTRPRRPHEEEGVSYFFVSDDDFDAMIEGDELLEWAKVHGYRYGVPAALVMQRLNEGLDVVCVIDVQGAQRIRSLFMSRALLIFIRPPDSDISPDEVLKQRMIERGDGEEEIERRMNTARWEMTQIQLYDHEVVNDDVHRAAREICDIVEREKAARGAVTAAAQQ